MPELPEVHTTVEGLKKEITGWTIRDIWSDFHIGTAHGERQTIKNKKYLKKFKETVRRAKITSVGRAGKNILINLNNDCTIVVHMKMTGHLMVGRYKKSGPKGKGAWSPEEKGPLQDPYNKFIHLVFSLSNGRSADSKRIKHLVLSDMRKFASVTYCRTGEIHLHDAVGKLGIDPLDLKFDSKKLFEIINRKKKVPIKTALLDQSALSGIGNIYSDEILWKTGIHPLSLSNKIPKEKFREIFDAMRGILKLSIKHGGDSKSDYRNVFGEKGGFQNFHKVYGRKSLKCPKPGCSGIIQRTVVRGRSAHFCPVHQKRY